MKNITIVIHHPEIETRVQSIDRAISGNSSMSSVWEEEERDEPSLLRFSYARLGSGVCGSGK